MCDLPRFSAALDSASDEKPHTGRVTPPVVKGIMRAAKPGKQSQLLVELPEKWLIGFWVQWIFPVPGDVPLQVNDPTSDMAADLGDVQPVARHDLANSRIGSDVTRHVDTLIRGMGVDKAGLWR